MKIVKGTKKPIALLVAPLILMISVLVIVEKEEQLMGQNIRRLMMIIPNRRIISPKFTLEHRKKRDEVREDPERSSYKPIVKLTRSRF